MIRRIALRAMSVAATGALAVFGLAFSAILLAPAGEVRANDEQATFAAPAQKAARRAARAQEGAAYRHLVQKHAAANGIPAELVHRVIMRESRYNPRAVSKGNYGIMQIRLGTARAMGYRGGVEGLLDADTNMTYAVKYLAGAYRAAGGNHDRAVMNYARGYYYQAKRQGFSPYESPRDVSASARARYSLSSAGNGIAIREQTPP